MTGKEANQPLRDVVALCAGDWLSAAVTGDGKVWRWGYDSYDEEEDTAWYFDHVVPVSGLPPAKEVACGAGFVLVLTRDGTVWGWGSNYFGQMGDSTDIDSIEPSKVVELNGVTAIAAGRYHSLALKVDGTVWRWGYSRFDEAEGKHYYCATPVQVEGLAGATGLAAGDWHTLVLLGDGTVRSWGFNYAGQLADGSFERFRRLPQPAVNATITGVLDLDPAAANGGDCPVVVGTAKSGSIDALRAGFRLFVGRGGDCGTRAGGYRVYVAAVNPASGLIFLLQGVDAGGAGLPAPTWSQWLGGALPMFAANAGAGGLDEHVQAVLIDGIDSRLLAGYDVYVGYGSSEAEMFAANRIKRIFTLGADGQPVVQS